MTHIVTFPSHAPMLLHGDHLTDAADAPHDADVRKMLELERERILSVTNYLEALCARLLTSASGEPPLAVVVEEEGQTETLRAKSTL